MAYLMNLMSHLLESSCDCRIRVVFTWCPFSARLSCAQPSSLTSSCGSSLAHAYPHYSRIPEKVTNVLSSMLCTGSSPRFPYLPVLIQDRHGRC